jgi:hypothetical protein
VGLVSWLFEGQGVAVGVLGIGMARDSGAGFFVRAAVVALLGAKWRGGRPGWVRRLLEEWACGVLVEGAGGWKNRAMDELVMFLARSNTYSDKPFPQLF